MAFKERINMKKIKNYTENELLNLKYISDNVTSESEMENYYEYIPKLIDEIIRLREYEWKYKELDK